MAPVTTSCLVLLLILSIILDSSKLLLDVILCVKKTCQLVPLTELEFANHGTQF